MYNDTTVVRSVNSHDSVMTLKFVDASTIAIQTVTHHTDPWIVYTRDEAGLTEHRAYSEHLNNLFRQHFSDELCVFGTDMLSYSASTLRYIQCWKTPQSCFVLHHKREGIFYDMKMNDHMVVYVKSIRNRHTNGYKMFVWLRPLLPELYTMLASHRRSPNRFMGRRSVPTLWTIALGLTR